ncbi:MAG: LysR family transcriptional regulator [Actinomycetota bacterium]
MDVHLRDLRYFVAVAEELHFGRAAERLFVSQPVLSRQVARLEAQLDVVLFDRNRRKVELTSAGETLLPQAQALLTAWAETERNLRDAASATAATLRIGLQTSVGRGILASLGAGLRQRRREWTIELNQQSWDDPTAGLATGTSDVAVCWLPLPDDAGYDSITIATEQRLIAVPSADPLAGLSSVTFAEIADRAMVALPRSAGALREHWLANDHRDQPAAVAATAHSAEEAMEAVAAGIGSALISSGNAELYARADVAFVPVDDLAPAELAIVWRSDDERPVVADLIEIARQLEIA